MKDAAKWAGVLIAAMSVIGGAIFLVGKLSGKTEVALAAKPAGTKVTIEERVAVAETNIEATQGDVNELRDAQLRYSAEHKADMNRIQGRFDDMQTEQTKMLRGINTLVERGKDGGGSP